ncbi:2-C-methyl-D-erythritol 4-phosphate cytidylyltransferase [Persephonella sp.]
MKVSVILLAAGEGKRFGQKKQFVKLKGEPLFQYSLNTINKIDLIQEIILVLPEEDIERIKVFSFKNVVKIPGGKERQDSVYNGLKAVSNPDIVVVHDSARPFATEKMFIDSIMNVKKGWDGSITAFQVKDTIKMVKNNQVVKTLNRDELINVQTPQSFKFEKLIEVHEKARKENIYGTDDAYLMERFGYKITVNRGSILNFKITAKEDLVLAECLVKGKKPF